MHSFNPNYIKTLSVSVSTSWQMGFCMEARGKQDLWLKQQPEVMRALIEQAIIQSAESSNRIEGVTIAKNRLRPLLIAKSTPRDRSEEEVLGYKKALDWIHRNYLKIKIEPKSVLRLHELSQASGDAGKWKERDNEIIEILPNGERFVRFTPVTSQDTPSYMEQLCLGYRDVLSNESFPPLLAVANFVFDFLCIHPFRDGNGRVSRLLTMLLLNQNGFIVGRYISLERLVEESKEEYYQALKRSSENWAKSKHDLLPWWNYFLSNIRNGYKEFEQKVQEKSASAGKTQLVEQAVSNLEGPFTLADVVAQCPAVSEPMIRKVLSQLKQKGVLRLAGQGRGAQWRKS